MFHPIYNTKTKKSMICQFGHDASWFIALFIILRTYIISKKLIPIKIVKKVSNWLMIGVFVVSLVNLNAVVYLLPYYLLETLYLKNMI